MPKKAAELTALEVKNLSVRGLWAVGGVAGLCLQVLPTGGRTWILRVVVSGKRRSFGLGGFPDVPLQEAKIVAREFKQQIRLGQDPAENKNQTKRRLAAERASRKTFAEVAAAYLNAHSQGWKHEKTHGQWAASLKSYVFPVVGHLLVSDINQSHVIECLEPIWKEKNETATRVRNRIESILAFATVRGYRSGDNPAQWRNHLDKLLPSPSKIRTKKHFAALPYDQVSAFMVNLRNKPGIAARALELLVLTATRSNEIRGAKWEEIDGDLWVIPAERMKAGKEHRVPLSTQAQALLKSLPKIEGSPYLFPSVGGKSLSDMALLKVVRDMNTPCVPHGFRSTFRDYAGDCSNFPREIAEQALAHGIRDKTEAAYRRSDALEKRRLLMQAWADYCDQTESAKVIQIGKAAA